METSFKPVSIPTNTDGTQPNQGGAGVNTAYSFARHDEESGTSPLQTILIVVTVIMVLIALGIFSWSMVLKTKIKDNRITIEGLQTEIQTKVASLNGDGSTKKLTEKFHIAKIIASEYPYVTNIFKILEHSTQEGIVYNKFDTQSDVGGAYSVNISGKSPGYHKLIQQVDILNTDEALKKYFSSIEVSSFKPNEKGEIEFTLKIKSNISGVDPENLATDLSASKADNNETGTTTDEVASQDNSGATSDQAQTKEQTTKAPVTAPAPAPKKVTQPSTPKSPSISQPPLYDIDESEGI